MSSFQWPQNGSASGVPTYSTLSAFPSASMEGNGALAIALDTNIMYESNGTVWEAIAGPGVALSVGSFGSTPNADGASLSGNVLTLQPADASHPGGVSTATQTFAGNKTVQGVLTLTQPSASGNTVFLNINNPATATPAIQWTSDNAQNGLLFYRDSTSTLMGQLTQSGVWKTQSVQSFTGAYSMSNLGTLNLIHDNSDSGNVQVSIKAASGQSADILEILNSTPSVIAKIDQSGNISGNNLSGTNSGDVTIGTANGLSLSGQQISLAAAGAGSAGAVTTGTQTLAGAKTFSTSITSPEFQSSSSNPAASGIVRLANTDGIGFRNIGNSADFLLQPDADGILKYNSIDLVNLSATQTLTNKTLSGNTATNLINGSGTFDFNSSGTITAPNGTDTLAGISLSQTLTNKTIAAGSNTISGLTNSNLSGSAAITNANLASMSNNTVKGNTSGSSGTPSDLTLASGATASSVAYRDTNANTQANNFVDNFATTATAGTTTTLTVSSASIQQFTGTLAQTVQLPAVSTLVTGFTFTISNISTGNVTVQTSGANTLVTAGQNQTATVTCVSTSGTNVGSWTYNLTATTVLSNPMTTGGDIIYGGASGVPTRLANGSSGQVLTSAGSTSAPTWAYPGMNVTSQTSNYNATINDYVLCSSSSFTVTLPSASSNSGKFVGVQHNGTSVTDAYSIGSGGSLIVAPGSSTISTYTIYTQGEVVIFLSNGTHWYVYNHYSSISGVSGGSISVSATSAFVFSWSSNQSIVQGSTYSDGSGNIYTVSTTTNTTTGTFSGPTTPASTGTLTISSGSGASPISWTSRTITGQPAIGTNSTNSVTYQRDGNYAILDYNLVQTGAGTAGSGDYLFYLPTGMTIDSTYAPYLPNSPTTNLYTIAGGGPSYMDTTGAIGGGATAVCPVVSAYAYSSTAFRVGVYDSAPATGNLGSGLNPLSGSALYYRFRVKVPIVNWQP